jgi:hypothetical protein
VITRRCAAPHHPERNDVAQEADATMRAIEGSDAKELRHAEELGKSHPKEDDPSLRRDCKRPDRVPISF